jgi:hypothetical protein
MILISFKSTKYQSHTGNLFDERKIVIKAKMVQVLNGPLFIR